MGPSARERGGTVDAYIAGSLADIDAPDLQSLVRTAVALNDAKGNPTLRR